jgi:hypothetical protein
MKKQVCVEVTDIVGLSAGGSVSALAMDSTLM